MFEGLLILPVIVLGYAAVENDYYLDFLTYLESAARGFAGRLFTSCSPPFGRIGSLGHGWQKGRSWGLQYRGSCLRPGCMAFTTLWF